VEQYAYRDNETGYFVTRKATVSDCGDFMQVSFRDEDVEEGKLPQATCLKGNSPNPFNPETRIEFELAKDSPVTLDVYNIKGQHICSLINENLPAARHEAIWNGKNNMGQEVSSGVYFYVLRADGLTLSHKMLMLK
jgi:flagellar hook assembly protein FlgD